MDPQLAVKLSSRKTARRGTDFQMTARRLTMINAFELSAIKLLVMRLGEREEGEIGEIYQLS